ncbi:MAG: protein kinase [Proteobacteria bacterium]|nr:protein kinase [Pseudomonadota bacterium]MCP4918329.1 protein kinase [Pseudomonadota bacterium]
MLRLGPFELLRPIARGGMGVVWRALHRRQGLTVAIKVLRPEARSRTLLDGLRNEVRAVASLEHPHIVWLYDQGEVGSAAAAESDGMLQAGTPWLAMEYCAGGTLIDNVPNTWRGLRELLIRLLDALAHAHARGVIHRDLKPANILFGGRRPGVKLTDFGMAYLQDRHLAGRARAPFGGGTAAWSSPEQIERRWVDQGPWTDLYSLGVLAWWMATGERPYEGKPELMAKGHLEGDLPVFRARFRAPEELETWLRRLLEKTPERRYRFAADAARALLELPGEGGATTVMVELDENTTQTFLPLLAGGAEQSVSPVPRDWRAGTVPLSRPELVGAGLGLHGLREAPLVARETERGALWEALIDATVQRRPRVVVLRGPAGSGKTRLAHWVLHRVHELGIAEPLQASHAPQRDGSREGLSELIGRHAHCADRRRGEVLGRLTRVLSRMGQDDLDEVLALTELVQPASPRELREGALAVRLDRDGRQSVARRYLERLTRTRPVVVVLDDAQWGLDSLLFVEDLLDRRVPVLAVVTVQNEALPSRPAEQHTLDRLLLRKEVAALELAPLDRDAGAELLRGLGLAPDVAAGLSDRSGGNPLFAVQLVGDWIERGLLQPGVEGLELPIGADVELPDGVRAVWSARVKRLLGGHPEWRDALEVASLLGIDMARDAWVRACGEASVSVPDDMWPRLAGLGLGRVERDRRRFGHAMLREAIVADCVDAGRAQGLHAACARALADSDEPARLGRHLARSGVPDEAAPALLEGAARRVLEGRYHAADRLLDERNEALLQARQDDPRRVEGWLLRARICSLRADLAAMARWNERARAAVEQGTALHARVLLREAWRFRSLGQLDRGQDRVEEAFRVAVAIGDHPLTCRCLYERGATARRQGDLDRAAALLQQALMDPGEEDEWVARAWLNLGMVAIQQRDELAARRALDRVESLAAREPFLIASAALARGDLLRDRSKPDAAEVEYRRAWRLFERIGHHSATLARLNVGLLAVAREDIDEGRIHLRACLKDARTRLPSLGAHLGLLVCSADLNHDGPWDLHVTALQNCPLAEADFARFLELAGTRAADAGFPGRALQAWGLAADQLTRLGRHQDAARVTSLGVR